MKLKEFLDDKNHSHCQHCDHVTLVANEHALFNMALVNNSAGHFNSINTILHLMTVHPEIYAADPELMAEVKACYDLEP